MTSHSPTLPAPDPRDRRIAELEARVAEQLQKLAELERAGKRQAARFARKKHIVLSLSAVMFMSKS